MRVDVTSEEREVLLRWKKRNDTLILVRLKAEAVLYASRGVDTGIISEMVDRTARTVREWLSDWRRSRLCSVVSGHAGNQNAAKLTRDQKAQLEEALRLPPEQSGIKAQFWDVPALRDVVQARFGVQYASNSSYQLLMRFLGMSFKLADPFDKRRDEEAITQRMAQIRQEVADLLAGGWEVCTVDEVRIEHEAETRRMWLPKGERTKIHVDRTRSAHSFFGALSLRSKKMKVYPIEGNQNAEQIILALARLIRETGANKIAVVLDNAAFHHARALKEMIEPGGQFESLRLIYLPPYAPDHNPTEHVWNAAKASIANIQKDTPENTCAAFIDYINSRTFDYDFEHLPIKTQTNDLVSWPP